MAAYFFLGEDIAFPHHSYSDEHGILAIGGDLRAERLLFAYESGIFPWYNEGQPIIWWSPDPRFVLRPSALKVSKSMRKVLRDGIFRVTLDEAFEQVIAQCSQIYRRGQDGTWINSDMQNAYIHLHKLGFAHSVEVWQGDQLVGGLYGIALGACFSGESMFSKVSNASKTGFITLVERLARLGFTLIDCQTHTPHLESLGATFMPRHEFLDYLEQNRYLPNLHGSWRGLLTTDDFTDWKPAL